MDIKFNTVLSMAYLKLLQLFSLLHFLKQLHGQILMCFIHYDFGQWHWWPHFVREHILYFLIWSF